MYQHHTNIKDVSKKIINNSPNDDSELKLEEEINYVSPQVNRYYYQDNIRPQIMAAIMKNQYIQLKKLLKDKIYEDFIDEDKDNFLSTALEFEHPRVVGCLLLCLYKDDAGLEQFINKKSKETTVKDILLKLIKAKIEQVRPFIPESIYQNYRIETEYSIKEIESGKEASIDISLMEDQLYQRKDLDRIVKNNNINALKEYYIDYDIDINILNAILCLTLSQGYLEMAALVLRYGAQAAVVLKKIKATDLKKITENVLKAKIREFEMIVQESGVEKWSISINVNFIEKVQKPATGIKRKETAAIVVGGDALKKAETTKEKRQRHEPGFR